MARTSPTATCADSAPGSSLSPATSSPTSPRDWARSRQPQLHTRVLRGSAARAEGANQGSAARPADRGRHGEHLRGRGLWQAQIHPLREAGILDATDVARLHEAVRTALLTGIEHQGATLSDYACRRASRAPCSRSSGLRPRRGAVPAVRPPIERTVSRGPRDVVLPAVPAAHAAALRHAHAARRRRPSRETGARRRSSAALRRDRRRTDGSGRAR